MLVACSKNEDDAGTETGETYSTEIYLTDAPVDNAEVQGVFVTIAEVKVNGKSLEGFQKTTVELSSLTEGNIKLLGNVELEAGNTSEIVLVLDGAADASGNAPGNYVLTAAGEKKALGNAETSINLNDKAEILAGGENELILDFDLRKSVTRNAEGTYSFVSDSRLSNSIRAVNKAETGTITGNISNHATADADAFVVYAYEAGSYSESETKVEDGLAFSNAVTSTAVGEANGEFSLHFIEEGDYQLVFASFEDTDNDGSLELQGQVEMSLTGGLDLNGITVEADSTIDLDVAIERLLGLH